MAGNASGTKKAKNNSAKKKAERSSIVLKTSENIGQVMIADDVVANIASLAALEVEGVGEVAGSATGELMGKVGIKNSSQYRGVKVDIGGSTVRISIAIVVKYGYPVPATGQQVQSKVSSAVETMTGLTVGDVNVHVVGVDVNA